MLYLFYLGDIDKRFGDIDCKYLCTRKDFGFSFPKQDLQVKLFLFSLGPGFTFDIQTAHIERDVTADGRLLRSDVTTIKRKTLRMLKKPRGWHTFDEIYNQGKRKKKKKKAI